MVTPLKKAYVFAIQTRLKRQPQESVNERGLQCKAGLTFFNITTIAFQKTKIIIFITIASKTLEVLFL